MTEGGNDLDAVDPAPVVVRIKGADREIRPVVAGNIPRLLRAVQPFVQSLLELPEEVLQKPEENLGDALRFLFGLIAEHGERVLEAISAATRIPLAEVNELEIDEIANLGLKAWEVNSDFFTRKLGPLLAGRGKAASRGDGLTR